MVSIPYGKWNLLANAGNLIGVNDSFNTLWEMEPKLDTKKDVHYDVSIPYGKWNRKEEFWLILWLRPEVSIPYGKWNPKKRSLPSWKGEVSIPYGKWNLH
ncbi:MAG: hypothetical protein IKX16_04685 [Clostridia bacterium]|nr:hypothetical protein [Clostridia bacterium]